MARQSMQFGGKTWVRDGSWWVDAAALAPYGGDPDSAPPDVVEGNRVKYREGLQQKTIEERGGVKSAQKGLRNNLVGEYGDERGKAVAKQRLAWAQEAERMGASPEIQDYLYFQDAVLLPGGIVASYTGGNGQLSLEDLHGNPVASTPELEQAAKQKHIEVYGEKYGQTQTGGGYQQPSSQGGPTGVSTPQMPGQPPPPPVPSTPPTTQPTTNRPPTAPPGPTETAPAAGGTRPPSPPAAPPTTRPPAAAPPRSPYPGVGGAPNPSGANGLSEQPGLGGSAAPAPSSATTGPANATPAAPGGGQPSTGPATPGLNTGSGGGGVQAGLGAPAQPPPPAPGQGGAGAAVPPAAPPPARSPYPGTMAPPQPQPAGQALSPYPGYHPPAPPTPRTVAMPGTLAQLGVPLPPVAPGSQFFDPFTGQFK